MDNNLLWDSFLEEMRGQLNPISYDAWFKDTKLVTQGDGMLVIEVPMQFHKKFLKDNYYDLIDEIIHLLLVLILI